LPFPLPFPTPPFPFPLPPDAGEELGEGAGLDEEPPPGVLVPEELTHDVVLFCHDLPAQSMLEFAALPSDATASTITAAIRKTMTEYSTAVAPRSFRRALLSRCIGGIIGEASRAPHGASEPNGVCPST
jgi:hypothetical protein